MRDLDPGVLAGLQNRRAQRHLDFGAVDRQLRHGQAARRCPAAAARYSVMRRSISGRKWRISPWTGQAAPLDVMGDALASARAGGLRSAEGEPAGAEAAAAAAG